MIYEGVSKSFRTSR